MTIAIQMDPIAERQALRILSLMGPYSVNKLLEALRAGQVEGGSYVEVDFKDRKFRPYDDETYHYTDEADGPIEIENFRGCLLGWAGFLENLSYQEFREKVETRYGFRRLSSGWNYGMKDTEDETTDEIEWFIRGIHTGYTPQNSPNAAALEQLILDFQAGRKAPVPVQDDEMFEENEDDDYDDDDDYYEESEDW
jgi:hypothetical protein